jgi:hypothetical protein
MKEVQVRPAADVPLAALVRPAVRQLEHGGRLRCGKRGRGVGVMAPTGGAQ